MKVRVKVMLPDGRLTDYILPASGGIRSGDTVMYNNETRRYERVTGEKKREDIFDESPRNSKDTLH